MMTEEEIALGDELEKIFTPLAYGRRKKIREEGGRFVHYTSAENAVNIIRHKKIWMRNARCMNDYLESYFGHQHLVEVFSKKEIKQEYLSVLNELGQDFGNQVLNKFDQWWNNIQFNTYITSVSEHDNTEDIHGRLSMWRAYGRDAAKAALVLKMPIQPGEALGLRVLFSPVEYLTPEQLETEFLAAVQNIKQHIGFLKGVKPELLSNMAFFMLVLAALCLKHEGFKEEREWRVICLPHALPTKFVESSVEVVGGVPQTVYKIPLVDRPDDNIMGLEIPKLVDRVIIGPSVYPVPINEAFVNLLVQAGMSDAASRVVFSNIPLRT